jgi:multidrug transporter EmrE-like cation transporter
MNLTVWILLLVASLFYTTAEYLSKVWTTRPSLWFGVLITLIYAVPVWFWLPALKRYNSLSILGAIWVAVYVVISVLLGWLVFGEAISTRHWVGIGLALVSIIILSLP